VVLLEHPPTRDRVAGQLRNDLFQEITPVSFQAPVSPAGLPPSLCVYTSRSSSSSQRRVSASLSLPVFWPWAVPLSFSADDMLGAH